MGALGLSPEDGLDPDLRSLVLLGPDGARFWTVFAASPEYSDGAPEPLDRWSARVIGALARDARAEALFPFGGPPWHPFIQWALRSGSAWVAPVGLLVHDSAGLMASFRGALALRETLPPPAPRPSPCEACADQPCRTACPAGAMTATGYDVPRCHAWLDTPRGQDCLTRGCAVRRACPLSPPRPDAQSAFHMEAFHR